MLWDVAKYHQKVSRLYGWLDFLGQLLIEIGMIFLADRTKETAKAQ
jgi:hypothetical protein